MDTATRREVLRLLWNGIYGSDSQNPSASIRHLGYRLQ